MKRSWTTYIPVAGLVALLALLGGLQYRWLRQISESDNEKAHRRLFDQTQRFASDFNREIQNAYFNFQTDRAAWVNRDWTAFNERYNYYREKANYPGLITDFYFVAADSDTKALRYDSATQTFGESDLPADLADIRAQINDPKTFKPVFPSSFILVLPVQNVLARSPVIRLKRVDEPLINVPDRYGFLLIRLDQATIKERILPDLNTKYFGDGEFRIAVTDKSGGEVYQTLKDGQEDASAGLFDLSPENFVFFAGKDLMTSIGGEKKREFDPAGDNVRGDHRGEMVVSQRVESHTFNRIETSEKNPGTYNVEIKREKTPQTAVFTTTLKGAGGPSDTAWTLLVQHSTGSLDISSANILRRNLAAGFGLLGLLAAAIGAIMFSAQRSKNLAQRQLEFVSSVSHEFRTPIAVIYSAGENLADGVARENTQVERYGDLIKGEGRKLSAMVEQILQFAGAKSGKRKFNFEFTDVAELMGSIIDDCRPLIDERGFELETSVSPNLPPVSVDKAAISQAIQNLVANSVKYSSNSKRLKLSAFNGDGRVKISVEDEGIGISKGDLKQIFEPFFRSKEVVDAQIHGNGLGLSLVKQIVDAHGGRIYAESEVGKGSKFTIELKAAAPLADSDLYA